MIPYGMVSSRQFPRNKGGSRSCQVRRETASPLSHGRAENVWLGTLLSLTTSQSLVEPELPRLRVTPLMKENQLSILLYSVRTLILSLVLCLRNFRPNILRRPGFLQEPWQAPCPGNWRQQMNYLTLLTRICR